VQLKPHQPAPQVRAILLCILGAACLALAQISEAAKYLVFIGWVPLVLMFHRPGFWRLWGMLALAYLPFAIISLVWLVKVGPGFRWLLPAACLAMGLLLAIPAALCCLPQALSIHSEPVLLLPAAWTLLELLGRLTLLRVWWPNLGQPLADWPLLSQFASWGGPETLTFMVVAVNVALGVLFSRRARAIKLFALLQGPGMLLIALVTGALSLRSPPHPGTTVSIAVIQPNISNLEKWSLAERPAHLQAMERLIDVAAREGPQMIVLPETSIPGFVRFEDDLTAWVKGTVVRANCPLLFGTLDRTEDASRYFNAAILITPYDTVFTYYKMRLVPFVESGLGLGLIGSIFHHSASSPGATPRSFTAGTNYTIFKTRELSFGTLICYEDIFPDLACSLKLRGAQLIVALINTERFNHSSLPLQHLRRARLTAVAAGLPILRCSNSGMSCLVDSRGRLSALLEDTAKRRIGFQGASVFTISLECTDTTYSRYGSTPGLLFLLGSLGLAVLVCHATFSSPLGRGTITMSGKLHGANQR
jgi:apolipoprotein N-acyltransferase